jgi:hypothetical protein
MPDDPYDQKPDDDCDDPLGNDKVAGTFDDRGEEMSAHAIMILEGGQCPWCGATE